MGDEQRSITSPDLLAMLWITQPRIVLAFSYKEKLSCLNKIMLEKIYFPYVERPWYHLVSTGCDLQTGIFKSHSSHVYHSITSASTKKHIRFEFPCSTGNKASLIIEDLFTWAHTPLLTILKKHKTRTCQVDTSYVYLFPTVKCVNWAQ